jgi:uncharacterized membrane protein
VRSRSTISGWVVVLLLFVLVYLALLALSGLLLIWIDVPGLLERAVLGQLGENITEEGRRFLALLIGYGWQAIIAALAAWKLYRPAKDWLDTVTAPKPKLPAFLSLPETKDDPVDYRAEVPHLVGRNAELAALNDFTASKSTFSWWWLQGPGGIGKSKLALAWVKKRFTSD